MESRPGPATIARMDISHVYGLRLLTRERGRTRLAGAAALGALLVYLVRAVEQIARLDVSNDYIFYRRAALGLANGRDIYAAFQQACPPAGAAEGPAGGGDAVFPAALRKPLLHAGEHLRAGVAGAGCPGVHDPALGHCRGHCPGGGISAAGGGCRAGA